MSRKTVKILLCLLLCVITAGILSAQPTPRKDTFRIHYRWDKSYIDTTYMSNAEQLRSLDSLLGEIQSIDSLYIVSSASPEGNIWYNAKLSKLRGEALHKQLSVLLKGADLGNVSVIPLGSNFDEFIQRLKSSTKLPYKSEVIAEFENHPKDNPDDIYKRIMVLRGGVPYAYIKRNILKEMRYAEVVIFSRGEEILPEEEKSVEPEVTEPKDSVVTPVPVVPVEPEKKEEPAPQEVTEPVDTTAKDVAEEPISQPSDSIGGDSKKRVHWYPAIKTNLLYDAVTAANVEVEFPVGKKFSIAVEDVFPWWNWGTNGKKYCFQVWEMGVEPRWWFKRTDKRDYLSGHFAGVYGMSGKYDLQWDTKSCYQGELWSAGLTYGYALPICRWLNMEFSISAGYLHSDYRHYQPDPAYEHLYRDKYKVGKISWFGPTKAKISLVVPIGRDSHNERRKR